MEGYKIKEKNGIRVIIHDFSADKERALRILEDEKKAREKMRKRAKLGIKVEIPKDIDKLIKEAEVA